jgi:hypothetical protein
MFSSLPDLIRQSMRNVGSAWTAGMGERSDAVLRTAMPGGDEKWAVMAGLVPAIPFQMVVPA